MIFMNICLVSSGSLKDHIPPIYGGGIQNYIYSISTYLASFGHKIVILTGLGSDKFKKYEQKGNLKIYRVKNIKNKYLSTITFAFNIIKIIKNLIRKEKIHLIHVNSRVSAAIIRIFFPNIPMIFTAHNWDVILAPAGYSLSYLIYPLSLLLEIIALKFSNSVICLSKYSCLRIRSLLKTPLNSKKLNLIPNLINLNTMGPVDKNLDKKLSNQKFFIFIGRFEKEKNLEFLINTFSKVIDRNNDIILYLIGTGSQYEYLKKYIQNKHLQENIKILYNIPNNEKYSYINRCLCLILPSIYEIMPTVILEAYAFKKPVLASNIPQNKELVFNGLSGYLFDPLNEDQLMQLINKIYNNEEKSKIMGKNGYNILLKKYSIKIISSKLYKVYRNLAR